MIKGLSIFIKGFLMGGANVVPGVSGGTVAFITGIYERLLNALSSLNLKNLKLLLSGKFKEFIQATDLIFLFILGLGVITSVKTISSGLDFAFTNYPTYVWSLFFGLILASIWTVGKTVTEWSKTAIVAALIGLIIAGAISFQSPASENSNFFYLILCGILSVCSMLIPGLSGSFILLLLGNYHLIVLTSLNHLSNGEFAEGLSILFPVLLGSIIGVLSLANALSWLFKTYHNTAVSLITGFITGSLIMIWPWKTVNEVATIAKNGVLEEKVLSYHYELPAMELSTTWIALGCMLVGMLIVLLTERFSKS